MTNWTSTSEQILAETVDGVCTITFNRPEKLNALRPDMRADLTGAIRLHGRPSVCQGIVITGAGRAFSAGEDLEVTSGLSAAEIEEAIETFNEISRAIFATEVPVVAALNGIAVGGGAEITLACDARIGAESAEYYLPENGRGLTISNASSFLLPRMLGPKSIGFVLDSRRLSSGEALELGLLDQVVPDHRLLQTATDLVRDWGKAGKSTSQHLWLLRPPREQVEAAMKREVAAARSAWEDGVTSPGVRAFLERDRRTGETTETAGNT